ncbi:hypothetical protein D3C71_2099280 [compost metagenome]
MRLERFQHLADSARSDAKLVGRHLDREMAGGGLESLQGIERGKVAAHDLDFLSYKDD